MKKNKFIILLIFLVFLFSSCTTGVSVNDNSDVASGSDEDGVSADVITEDEGVKDDENSAEVSDESDYTFKGNEEYYLSIYNQTKEIYDKHYSALKSIYQVPSSAYLFDLYSDGELDNLISEGYIDDDFLDYIKTEGEICYISVNNRNSDAFSEDFVSGNWVPNYNIDLLYLIYIGRNPSDIFDGSRTFNDADIDQIIRAQQNNIHRGFWEYSMCPEDSYEKIDHGIDLIDIIWRRVTDSEITKREAMAELVKLLDRDSLNGIEYKYILDYFYYSADEKSDAEEFLFIADGEEDKFEIIADAKGWKKKARDLFSDWIRGEAPRGEYSNF